MLRVGAWFPGYLDVESSAEELARLGVREHAVTVPELNDAFAAVAADRIAPGLAALAQRGWTHHEGPADARSMRLALALDDLVRSTGSVAVTVNCHSDVLRWNPAIGITACLGASLLTAEGIPVSCTGDLPTALALVLARALSGRALYCEFYTPERDTGLMLLAAGGEGDPAWADPAHPVVVEPNDHYPGDHGSGTVHLVPARAGPGDGALAVAGRRHVAARLGDRRDRRGALRHDGRPERHVPVRLRLRFRGRRPLDRLRRHAPQRARGGRLDVEIPVLARALGIEEVRV